MSINSLFGAPQDAPDASFQGVPLDTLFNGYSSSTAPANTPATTTPLW